MLPSRVEIVADPPEPKREILVMVKDWTSDEAREQQRIMRLDPETPHRRSIRLEGYDYTQPAAYFVTVVTNDRGCLFGEVVDGEMR